MPGSIFTYSWSVPERSGPGPGDSSCLTWAYSSSVNFVKDTNSGLIGPLIVCRKGTLDRELKPTGVDKEFALLFTVTDENKSWYLDENINKYAGNPTSVNKEDGHFIESNLMHGRFEFFLSF